MDDPAQHLAILIVLSRGNASAPARRGQEGRRLHSQWFKDVFLRELVEWHSGDLLYQKPQCLEIDVAIAEDRSGRRDRLLGVNQLPCRYITCPRRLQIKIAAQS